MKKIALITGARGGIGTAITAALLEQGYRIIATHSSTSAAAAREWFDTQGHQPDRVRLLALDVADTAMCRETLGHLLQEEGRVDVLVNNAGITWDGAFKRMTPDQWFEVIHTNLCSLYNVTQPLFDAMCEQRDARIINISSVNGQKGQFGQVNYSAAKAGMLGFTKALAAEGPASESRSTPSPRLYRHPNGGGDPHRCARQHQGRHSHAPPRQARRRSPPPWPSSRAKRGPISRGDPGHQRRALHEMSAGKGRGRAGDPDRPCSLPRPLTGRGSDRARRSGCAGR